MTERGSAVLRQAWERKGFHLTDDMVGEIVDQLDVSPATVHDVRVTGGAMPTGISIDVSYEGDDVPWCGNDLSWLIAWHLKHQAPTVCIPRPLVDGIPFPDLIKATLHFGQPVEAAIAIAENSAVVREQIR